MSKPLRTILLPALITLAYLLVFPRHTGEEPLIERSWAVDIEAGAEAASADGSDGAEAAEPRVMPFRLGPVFGYFYTDGRILSADRVLYGLAQSGELFSNYSVVSENIVLQDRDGGLVRSIPASGYPQLDAGRLYVFAPDGSTVSQWTVDGAEVWRRNFVSVLTDLDGGPAGTAVGLLNGELYLLDAEGEETFSYTAEGSRIGVTLSVAVGRSPDVFAAVSGIDPQRLILFERHSEGFFPVFQLDLESDYRRSVVLEFLPDGRSLVVEQPGGVLVYDRHTEGFSRIDLGGPVEVVDSMSAFDLVLTASRPRGSSGRVRLQATVRESVPLFAQEAETGPVFLRAAGNRFYLGLDGRLACIELLHG